MATSQRSTLAQRRSAGVLVATPDGRVQARIDSPIRARPLFPPATLSIAAVLLALGALGPNTALMFFAVIVLLTGTALLWRPGESPILIFVFVFQWLQASAKLFHANWLGADVQELAEYSFGTVEQAIMLSLVGLSFLALGMRLGAGPWGAQDAIRAKDTALSYEPKTWFKFYVIAFAVGMLAQTSAKFAPSLSQPILAVASLKWAFFWMLAYATFVRGANFKYWLIALGVELLLAMGAYFSEFKTPLFFTLFAAAAARTRMSAKSFVGLGALLAVTLSLAVVWTAIKIDYRAFVSEGKGQVVRADYSERLATIRELVAKLDRAALGDAAEQLAKRLSYVDFFAVTLYSVPAIKPHEYGALWWDAFTRPFMPRLFFPEKAAINDSDRTNYYTGLAKADAIKGASISIGYMGESYIDFGFTGMMVPIFALGLLLGGFYRWAVRVDRSRVFLGMALATATIFGATFLETSITKLFGGLVVAMLVSWAILRIIAPRYIPIVNLK